MALLLCVLGLQALPAAWIPERPASLDDGDAPYLLEVGALASANTWPWEQIQALRADTPARNAALAAWLPQTDVRAQSLCAILGSGCRGPLAEELFRIGAQSLDESLGVACLLAPAAPDPAWWPALASAALSRPSPLAVRAAAAARLLEAGCWGVWPIARSILRSGTAWDEPAPWADWTRAGRYELPKRLLVSSIDICLAQAGQEPCGFEPNASWADQVDRLRAIEPRAQALKRAAAVAPRAVQDLPTWKALLRSASAGDLRATAVLGLLADPALPLLRAALAGGDPNAAWMVRRALDERPL